LLQLGDYAEFTNHNDIFLATAMATLSTAKMRILRAPMAMQSNAGAMRYHMEAEIYVYMAGQRREVAFPLTCIIEGANKQLAPVCSSA
jgi:hypothetical protein